METESSKKGLLRHQVFWPPFIFLLICTYLSIFHADVFFTAVESVNSWILNHFDWLFSWTTFACILLLIAVYASPLGRIRIGGPQAVPLLSKWRLFAITLCSTIATGILFWGAAEPLFHLHDPPASLGLTGNSTAARDFAMSTMFMHWTLTPYSVYTVMGLLFALCFYNLKQPFSLAALLYPVLGKHAYGYSGNIINIICLFALVSGMAASLGAGILTISGGLNSLMGIPQSVLLYGLIAMGIALAFIISAGSGLMKGIRLLSDYNIRIFIFLSLFVFFAGPIGDVLTIGWEGLKQYFATFFQRSLNVVEPMNDSWLQSWTVFYWANWLAWAPVTALFLGRIARGYTVRQYIHFNLLLPSLFGGLWMIIFSGISLQMDMATEGSPLHAALTALGPQSVIYNIFDQLPWGRIISMLFLFIVFLSFVTAADSNTSAMSGISSTGIRPDQAEAPFFIKVSWGILIALVSWVMIAYAGIDGVKIISTIGGFPALFLAIAVCIGLVKLILKPGNL